MKHSVIVVTCVWLSSVTADLKFPPNFEFGVATSSYQIEGAWNVSDKSVSVWDYHTHTRPDLVAGGATGDIACNSYHQWRDDLHIIKELGVHFYRFSISWPRLMPTGFADKISEDGKRYYNMIIDDLIANDVKPVVTLYHWELPQRLQNLGGWTNPLIADWFADYAREVYDLFGDRVQTWITINEPLIFCHMTYNLGVMAPAITDPQIAAYLCSKHAMIAHAKAWRVYDKEFRNKYNGKVSLTNQALWYEGVTEKDEEYAELVRQYGAGLFSHPIFSEKGGWPPAIEKIIAQKSCREGLGFSKLPAFTQEEIALVKGTHDFYGLNYYTARVVRKPRAGEEVGAWPLFGVPDLDLVVEPRPNWNNSGLEWFYVYPEGIRRLLYWLKQEYSLQEIMIIENGFSGHSRRLDDHDRVRYYEDHLAQVLLAIKEDGVNVTAYTAWSLMDNFEWNAGYEAKFGFYDVDFEDPSRPRTARVSAKYYANVLKTHSVVKSPMKSDEL